MMTMCAMGRLGLLGVIASACGGAAESPDGGGARAGGGGMSGPEACRAYFDALAAKGVECAASLGAPAPSRDALRAQMERSIPGGCAAVTGLRDPNAFQSTCLPAFRNIDCSRATTGGLNPAALPTACANPFVYGSEAPPPDAGRSPGCVAESDPDLCSSSGKNCGLFATRDLCGAERMAICGSCSSPATCGGGGTANVCGAGTCVPETDARLCARMGKNCGLFSSTDNCGRARTVASCGSCRAPDGCGGAGTRNVCGSTMGAGPSNFTGIGSSFVECNGRGRVEHYGPTIATQIIDVTTAWIFGTDSVSGRGNKVFGYTRPQIQNRTFPLVGTVGEYQLKLAIDAPQPALVVGQQYAGMIALSQWDPTNNRWSGSVGSQTAVVIQILDFTANATAWSDGHWCAGRLVGRVESIVDGTGVERLDFDFYAPLLTPSFPSGTLVCQSETDNAFCSRLGKTCGSFTATDNCGSSRTVSCGSCSSPQTCSSGVCVTPPTCKANGLSCAGSSECCSSICVSGVCESSTSCDPVANTGCSSPNECVVLSSEATTCALTGSGIAGSSCSASSPCAGGHGCFANRCRKICEKATGQGCPSGSVCNGVASWTVYGACN